LNKEKNLNIALEPFSYEKIKELMKKGEKKFVFMDNYLIDVEHYAEYHPGGKNLLTSNYYQDVSRYLIGSVPFNSKFKGVDHLFLSCLYALKFLSFGELIENHRIIMDESLDKSIYLAYKMEVIQTRVTAGPISEITFKLTEGRAAFARFLTGIRYMGKHFSVFT